MVDGVAQDADPRCEAVLYIGGEALRCVRMKAHDDRHKHVGRAGEAKASVLGHWAVVWDQEPPA